MAIREGLGCVWDSLRCITRILIQSQPYTHTRPAQNPDSGQEALGLPCLYLSDALHSHRKDPGVLQLPCRDGSQTCTRWVS